jgi:hypothetical protein
VWSVQVPQARYVLNSAAMFCSHMCVQFFKKIQMRHFLEAT